MGDQISSVTVAPHTLVILFEHRNFQGDFYKLINNGDDPHLFNLLEIGMIELHLLRHQGLNNNKILFIKKYE